MKLAIFTDGGARGNPGPAAVGVAVLDDKGREIFQLSKYIGRKTNNEAEYRAVLEAFVWLLKEKRDWKKIDFYLDSKLVVSQLEGRFKIKAQNLKPLFFQIQTFRQKLSCPVFFHHVPREKNKRADRLVNLALDKRE